MTINQQKKLMKKARSAMRRAYAPYSRFKVGAALMTKEGRIFQGCNVENSSFGLTLCAERAALVAAVAAGQRHFRALAVVASGSRAPMPCGACLQVLAEFCPRDFIILTAVASKPLKPVALTLIELLPHAFRL